MHEVSIALGIVDELKRVAADNNAEKVNKVKLKIGKLSGIVTESLRFAFDAVKLEHPMLTGTEIIIEEVPLVYKCNECGRTFNADDIYFPSCPECDSNNLMMISGEEQDIENVELEVKEN